MCTDLPPPMAETAIRERLHGTADLSTALTRVYRPLDEAWIKGWAPFRTVLAPAIGRLLGVDVGAVQVCGSARFGFSMIRPHAFEAHRSDLDVAVIDRALFYSVVAEIADEAVALAPYLRVGMVRLDRLPNSPRFARWRSGLVRLKASGCWPFSEITVSIYAEEADFLCKQAYALLMFRARMTAADWPFASCSDGIFHTGSTDAGEGKANLKVVGRLLAALNLATEGAMPGEAAGAAAPLALRRLAASLPYLLRPVAIAWPAENDDRGLLFLAMGEPTERDEVFQSLRALRRLLELHAPDCRTILLGLSGAQMAAQLAAAGDWAAATGPMPMVVASLR